MPVNKRGLGVPVHRCGLPVAIVTHPIRVVSPRAPAAPDTWSMALMGIKRAQPAHWLKDNRAALPSIIALLGVAVFWVVGAVGGIGFLREASSPMAMLAGLYVMLAAVAVSIIIATLALTDVTRRLSRRHPRRFT